MNKLVKYQHVNEQIILKDSTGTSRSPSNHGHRKLFSSKEKVHLAYVCYAYALKTAQNAIILVACC